jgi:hypothetical protein
MRAVIDDRSGGAGAAAAAGTATAPLLTPASVSRPASRPVRPMTWWLGTPESVA